jgi:hypothetical protein
MKTCHAGSLEDLTIIIPRSGVCATRDWSGRLASEDWESTPRAQGPVRNQGLQHQKMDCLARKRCAAQRRVLGTMLVLALVLATTLSGAARKAARSTPTGDDAIAAEVVGQSQPPEKAGPILVAQNPLLQARSAEPIHGTAVNFVATPTQAAREAQKNHKLMFLLHISGNFEDADFT